VGNTPNWCGWALANPGVAYAYVEGNWIVPTVTPQPGDLIHWEYDFSSMWVGLDGLNTNDVVQAGTEQDTYTFPGVSAAKYSAWTENFPANTLPAQVSVNPGDNLYVSVWVGTANATLSTSGGYGWYYLYNATKGTVSYTSSPLAYPFTAATAEWIVEKPTVLGLPAGYGLANFGNAKMLDAYAFDPSWGVHSKDTEASWVLNMMNGYELLCYPGSAGPATTTYQWYNY
jgi:hypothetical protein